MQPIVTISCTSRPANFTSRALAVVEAQLSGSGRPFRSFDARELELAFPGQRRTADAETLTDAVTSSSGVILATPEYHGSFSAMTKLVIENLGFPSALRGKAVGLLGVAAGRIGAVKSLEHLRGVCSHIGAVVMPSAVSIAGVQSAFDDDGQIIDEAVETTLRGFADSFAEFIESYICPKMILEEQVRDSGAAWTTSV